MAGGRPRSFDPDDALDAVVEVLHRRGVVHPSMNEVLREAGVTKPNLYAAYGDKEGVIAAAVERYVAAANRRTETALRTSRTVPEIARAFLQSFVDAFDDRATPAGCLLATATCELTDVAEGSLRSVVDRANDAAVDGLAQRLDAAGSTRARQLARFLVGQTVALSVLSRGGATRGELQGFADLAVAAVASGPDRNAPDA